jgi:hypothetical protein
MSDEITPAGMMGENAEIAEARSAVSPTAQSNTLDTQKEIVPVGQEPAPEEKEEKQHPLDVVPAGPSPGAIEMQEVKRPGQDDGPVKFHDDPTAEDNAFVAEYVSVCE